MPILARLGALPLFLALTAAALPILAAPSFPVQATLEDFVAASKPNRSVGLPGHEKAFAFLKSEFEKIGTKAPGAVVRVHSFQPDVDFAVSNYQSDFKTLVEGKFPPKAPEYRKWKTFTDNSVAFVKGYRGRAGRNVILEIPGTKSPKEVVYVGAHYDTITHDHTSMRFTPERPTLGADDNASGVAALVEVARTLAASKPERTIRFIAFDYEEIFFLGSYALARDLAGGKLPWAAGEKVAGLFNLEMIGWARTPSLQNPVMKLYTRAPEDRAATDDLRLAHLFEAQARRLGAHLRPVVVQNGFNRSDNWSFWQAGFPSICITEDWENDFNEAHYHTPDDRPRTLNYDYLSEITRVTTEAVREAAGGH